MKRRVFECGALALLLLLVGCGPQPGGNGAVPVAVVTYTPARGEVPLHVMFDASLSAVPGGTIRDYVWDFGDGATGSGAVVSHWYRGEEKMYLVTLSVTSDKGTVGKTQVPVWAGQSYPLDVLSHTAEETYFGQRVFGTVRNIGDRKINQGRIVVQFRDRDWNVIRERSRIVADLLPGAEQIFDITTELRIAEFGGAPHYTIYTEVLHSDHPLSP